MTNNTVGLSLKEAAAQAESELALTDASGETVISPEPPVAGPKIEQPTVETEVDTGVLDSLTEQPEEPEEESGELYEVNGEMITLEELRSGYMRHGDYTQKTQGIADEKREAEKALTLMKLLEERPVETVRALYQQISTGAPISGLVEATKPTPAADQPIAPTDIDALVEARVAEQLANDPRLVQVQEDQALAQVNSIFEDIEGMYNVSLNDRDKQLVLQTAVDMGTDDLKFVFGGLMNQANQQKIALDNAKKVTPTAPQYEPPKGEGPVVPEKYENFRSAVNAALAAEQGL